MFDSLSDRLDSAFKQLKGHAQITELNIAATVKEIRRALVDADVNYKIAKEFTNTVKDKAMGTKVLQSVEPGQQMVKIVKDELAELMGGKEEPLHLESNPAVILIAGLQGSGKTTFSAKLASFLKTKKHRNPMLVAGDVYRPAAVDQLKVLAGQINVPVYSIEDSKDPVAIAKAAVAEAKEKGQNTVIVDTAGRLAVDEAMMTEVANIKAAINPDEILFVVDSMTGQDAVNTAKAFNERLNFDGVVLTKLDGDTRGGAALSIKYTVEKPIKFVSSGEKIDTLDVFYPERMAQRILGMGDITTLVERAQEQYDEAEARKLEKKIRKNQFDFEDFKGQVQQIKKMGNIKDLLSMMPGVGKAIKNIDISDDAFKDVEAIIDSMTPYERKNPQVINGSRRLRIAKGSGKQPEEISQFFKQFDQMRKMMKQMNAAGGGRKSIRGLGM